MLIDTHCHLGDPAFEADRDDVVVRMGAAGVHRAVVIESDLARLDQTLRWVAQHAALSVATGCHPHDAAHWNPAMADRLRAVWRSAAVVAAGEMGLDYHYDHAPRDVQRRVFSDQLALAAAAGRPAIIHAREADDDVAAIAREQPDHAIVLHSFSSGPTLRDAGLEGRWYFSFSGMVTFRSWADVATLQAVPDDRLLIETDAPYLAPVPFRGKRNEPAYVAAVAARVAEVRGSTTAEIERLTTANAMRLFFPSPEPA